MIETRTRPLCIYPNNSVFFHRHYKDWESKQFLEKHKIPLKRKEDKEISIQGEEGVCYATMFIDPEKKKKCKDCGEDISYRMQAIRCIACARNKQSRVNRKVNRELRGYSRAPKSGLKEIMTTYNQTKGKNTSTATKPLDDLSWTGVPYRRLKYE